MTAFFKRIKSTAAVGKAATLFCKGKSCESKQSKIVIESKRSENAVFFFERFAKRLLKPYFSLKRKKAMRKYPVLDEIISSAMQKQSETEKQNQASVDIAADPSAKAMGEILCQGFEGEEREKLNRFGYLVGRWVYLVDALDDMEDDKKNSSYNVFNNINKNEKEAKDYAVGAINLTAGQLVRQFEEMKPARFNEIMENIVYDGLHNSMKEILNKKEEKK